MSQHSGEVWERQIDGRDLLLIVVLFILLVILLLYVLI